MKTFTITMEWNEAHKKWLMYLGKFFVYDFWDSTIRKVFEGLSKLVAKKFKITIEKVED